jgi:outer membrane protein assembly factor BamB
MGLYLYWSYQAGGTISDPVVANGLVYFGSDDGNVYALNPKTKKVQWQKQLGGPLGFYAPAADNGRVYIVSPSPENLYALDASTGEVLWQAAPDASSDFGSPAVANGVVYTGSVFPGDLHARNVRTGALLWDYPADEISVSTPAVDNGFVYIATYGSGVQAVDAGTHKNRWKNQLSPGPGDPAVANGAVYVPCEFCLNALDANDGHLLWGYGTVKSEVTHPAVAQGLLYFGDDYGNFYVTTDKGREVWFYQNLVGELCSTPAVANGVVYFGWRDGYLYAFDAKTGGGGVYLWRYPTGTCFSSPAVADGVLYGGAADTLYIFHLSGNQ